jgi:hypothetical protein
MNVRDTIHKAIIRIVEEGGHTVPPLTDDTRINAVLDSLGFTTLTYGDLVAAFNVNPIEDDDNIDMPTTIGELIKVYEHAVATV